MGAQKQARRQFHDDVRQAKQHNLIQPYKVPCWSYKHPGCISERWLVPPVTRIWVATVPDFPLGLFLQISELLSGLWILPCILKSIKIWFRILLFPNLEL